MYITHYFVVCQLQDADPEEFQVLVNTLDNDFLMSCGIMKPPSMLQFAEKEKIISAVCLHSSILSTLAELEQLRRGLQTAKFSLLMEQHPAFFKPYFLHSSEVISADFIQDLFSVQYSLAGSNRRAIEEKLMINWISYLKDLEGMYAVVLNYIIHFLV